MIDPKDVTIIIPHLGRTPESKYAIKQCLISLQETVPDITKIVVINGLKFNDDFDFIDESIEVNNLKFIVLEDQGQCKAVNAAVATTNTPWVFITNDDMVYGPDWFNKLTMGMVNPSGEGIKCISPQLVEPKQGAPTFLVEFCGGAGGDFNKQKWLEFYQKHPVVGTTQAQRTGFNLPLLISRELWDTVRGYNINYDPWGSNSDSDLEYKIRLAGVQPYQNTNCLVYHFSQTSGTFQPENSSYYQRNFEIFKDDWGFDRTDEGIWEANFHMPTRDEGRIFIPSWEARYGVVY